MTERKVERKIAKVFSMSNGMTAVFDQFGQQMPEFQGPTDEVMPKIRAAGFTEAAETVGTALPPDQRVSFRIGRHHFDGAEIVEIIVEGIVVGAIYPVAGKQQMQIVSAHMTGTEFDDGKRQIPSIPSCTITFNPRPYHLDERGQIIWATKQ